MKRALVTVATVASMATTAVACDDAKSSDEVFTLYRPSMGPGTVGPIETLPGTHVAIATFDGAGKKFNWENCQQAARLFTKDAAQYPARLNFWCEPGYRRPDKYE
jgi:hypothetical protein